jgi:hypothetical protein
VLRAATVARYAADGAWHHLPTPLRYGVRRYRVDPAGTPVDPDDGAGAATAGRHEVVDGVDRLVATIDGQALTVDLPGPGRALAENALGALRVAVDLGVPLATAAERLAAAALEPGRLTRRTLGAGSSSTTATTPTPPRPRRRSRSWRGRPDPTP